MPGGNSTECNKKCVVNSASIIVEECTHDFLDAVFARIIKRC